MVFNGLAAVFHQTPDVSIKASDVYLFTDSIDTETVEPIRELLSENCCVHIIELTPSNDNLTTFGEHSFGCIARFCSHNPEQFAFFTSQIKLKSFKLKQSNGVETEIPLLSNC